MENETKTETEAQPQNAVGSTDWLAGDYSVETGLSPYALANIVRIRIKQGWQPIGGVARGGRNFDADYMQAMVKPANNRI